MISWRIIVNGGMPPALNMAVDEAIYIRLREGKSQPTIRFYGWVPATASFGYNQEINKEISIDILQSRNLGYVRRPTGGRLVLHDQEITYAVIAPAKFQFQGNITASYAAISQALAAGFGYLGIKVDFEKGSLSPAHQRESSNPCFSSSSRYELNYQHRKIVGSAQVRKDDYLLQHGSILLDKDQSGIAWIIPDLSAEQRLKMAHYLGRKTVAVNQILEKSITFREGVEAFIQGFRSAWNNDYFHLVQDLEDEEKILAGELVENKYSRMEWNAKK